MRYIRYVFLALLAICLVTLALANREPVTLNLLSSGVAGWVDLESFGLRNSVNIPLFLVIFASIIAGLMIGFVWEWMREHRMRADASAVRREKNRLEREVEQLRDKGGNQKDDILTLLES